MGFLVPLICFLISPELVSIKEKCLLSQPFSGKNNFFFSIKVQAKAANSVTNNALQLERSVLPLTFLQQSSCINIINPVLQTAEFRRYD